MSAEIEKGSETPRLAHKGAFESERLYAVDPKRQRNVSRGRKRLMPKTAEKTPEEKVKAVSITNPEILGLVRKVREVFGSGSGIILYYAGFGVGGEMAGGADQSKGKIEDFYKVFQDLYQGKGWGLASIKPSQESPDSGKISFSEFPFSEDEEAHEVVEMLMRGMFSGFMAKAYKNAKVSFQKEDCMAKGGPSCTFSFRIEVGE